MREGQKIYEDRHGLSVSVILTPFDDEYGTAYTVSGPADNPIPCLGNKVLDQALDFQLYSPLSHGVNGLTNESLLAILIHRLSFQDSKFSCIENKIALSSMRAALTALEERTNKRQQRGVEGQHQP